MVKSVLYKKTGLLIMVLFSSIMVYSQTGNNVFSGSEQVNFGEEALSTTTSWTTFRGVNPGYFSAMGTAIYTNIDDTHNVNGYVKHYTRAVNQGFTFPVGTGSDLRTLTTSGTISNNIALATAWIMGDPSGSQDPTAPNSGAHDITPFETGLTFISPIGQWDWQDINGGANGTTITVSIPDMTSFSPASELRLVGWDGTKWVNLSGTFGASGNIENSTLSGTMVLGITALAIGTIYDKCTYGATVGTGTDNDPDGDGLNNICDLDDDNDGIIDTDESCGLSDTPVNFSGLTNIGGVFRRNTAGTDVVHVTLTAATVTAGSNDNTNGGMQESADTVNGGGIRLEDANPATNGTKVSTALTFSRKTNFKISSDTKQDSNTANGPVSNVDDNHSDLIRFTVVNPDPGFMWNFSNANFINTTNASFSITGNTLELNLGIPTSNTVGFSAYNFTVIGEATGLQIEFETIKTLSDSNLHQFAIFTELDVDTDNDGLRDCLDLDSDGDSCPDALEGAGIFAKSQLTISTMDGGNSGTSSDGTPYSGSSNIEVKDNFDIPVNINGIPTIVTNGTNTGAETTGQATTSEVTDTTVANGCVLPKITIGDVTVIEGVCTFLK